MKNTDTYASFETKDRMFKKFTRNVNGLELRIDPSKTNPVVYVETEIDEFDNCDDVKQDETQSYMYEADVLPNGNFKKQPKREQCKEPPVQMESSENVVDDIPNGDTIRSMRGYIKRKWFVLLAGFILIFVATGIPFQLSILYTELLDEFQGSNAETSLVQAVCTGTFFGGGFISGVIVTRYGVQVAGTLSGFIAATGMCLSFLATNIPFLVITLGATTGYGFCLAYVCSSTCVGMHFVGRGKLLAMSFVSFGSGVGAMSFSYILELLIQMYGWRGTLLILGGLALNFIPAALLCVPVKNKHEPDTRVSRLNNKPAAGNDTGFMLNKAFEMDELDKSIDVRKSINGYNPNTTKEINHEKMNRNKQPLNEQKDTENKTMKNEVSYRTDGNGHDQTNLKHDYDVRKNAQSTWKGIKTVLQNKIFLLYLFGMALSLSAFNSILIFLIDFYQSKDLDRSTSVFLLFILNTVGAAGRFMPGLLKGIPHMSITTVSAMCCASGCVSAAMFPFTDTYPQVILASCFYGLSLGGAVTTGSLGTMKLVGIRFYSTGLGILLSISSIGVISAGPVSGKLRDISGSYDLLFFTTASSLGFASVIFALTSIFKSRSRKGMDELRMDIVINRRMSRRRSSILPWRRSLEFVY